MAALGSGYGLLPIEGQSLIVAGALISIILNPFVFRLAAAIQNRQGALVSLHRSTGKLRPPAPAKTRRGTFLTIATDSGEPVPLSKWRH